MNARMSTVSPRATGFHRLEFFANDCIQLIEVSVQREPY
jgi:hypothetical protein